MSIEDDIALLSRVPTLRLLGTDALRILAIGSEPRTFARGDVLFHAGDAADSGFIVESGSFLLSVEGDGAHEVVAGPGALIGELALLTPMSRPVTAVAQDYSTAVRIPRSLFQRVLEGHPDAARRLRDEIAGRTSQFASDIVLLGAKLS